MKLGLIGYPLGHSWSPNIHAFFLKEDCYRLYELKEEDLPSFFASNDLDGFNVTIPYKQTVMQYLDEIDPLAKAIGAVNTVVHKDGKYYGYNTDYQGFMEMLVGNGIDVKGRHAAVLGSGGVSKAITAGLRQLGCTYEVVSRHPENAQISYEDLYANEKNYSVLVNATPVGMTPKEDASPADLSKFTNLYAVVDAIANPLCTDLCFEAKTRGIKTCGGFEMLVRQALVADRWFTGHDMDETQVMPCMNHLLEEKRNIVLIGMPTSGKSTIAQSLAKTLNRPLIEMDAELEQQLGTSIAECFANYGETYFRDLESNLAKSIPANGSVVSCGGGIIKRKENMRHLSRNSIIFWIDRDIELLYGSEDRPLSRSKEDMMKLYEERKDLYAAYSDVRIENNGTLKEAEDRILQVLEHGRAV